jgi:hypothetical protein
MSEGDLETVHRAKAALYCGRLGRGSTTPAWDCAAVLFSVLGILLHEIVGARNVRVQKGEGAFTYNTEARKG